MSVWNVCVPVIANLEAPDGEAAKRRLRAALEAAGFATYGPTGLTSLEPFEAEEDTEAEVLPGEVRS